MGLALVEVPRFRAVLERRGARFTARVFSPAELAYAANKKQGWQNLAARFAAKLAGRQALGRGLPIAAFEVERLRSGAPRLRCAARPEVALFLSLTHDADFALASVWVEAAP